MIIDRAILNYYRNMGAEASWIGFPVKGSSRLIFTTGVGDASSHEAYRMQDFEGGAIYWRSNIGAIAVPKVLNELIARDAGGLGKRLGLPRAEEQSIGGSGTDRIQFFDNGVVTLRNGKHEIWLRP